MKKISMVLGLGLALLPALAGCGGVKSAKYYALNLPAAADPPAPDNVRTSIAVRQFRCPNYLRQGPIVYRPSPEQIGFYEYHRWAADPRQVVTSAIVDTLRASGQFATVSIYDGRHDNDYVFTGTIEKLEEVDYESGVKVEVALSAQITRISTGTTIWANSVSEVENVSERTMPGVVAQMNKATELAIAKLLSTFPAQLASSKKTQGAMR